MILHFLYNFLLRGGHSHCVENSQKTVLFLFCFRSDALVAGVCLRMGHRRVFITPQTERESARGLTPPTPSEWAGNLPTLLPCSSPGLPQTRRSPETVLASRRSPPSGPCGPDVGNKRRELGKKDQTDQCRPMSWLCSDRASPSLTQLQKLHW